MEQPNANDLIRVWESGGRRHPVDRAMLLLFLACPDETADKLWQLTVGDRNRRLLSLYQQTVGNRLECIATCRHCGEKNKFTAGVEDIRYDAPEKTEGELSDGGLTIRFRQPNNLDLAAAAAMPDIEAARLLLARRCILAVKHGRTDMQHDSLSDKIIVAIGDAIREQDPQVEMHFDVICAECEKPTPVMFDIVSFVWVEVSRFAQRALHEVHVLARAYGWSEVQILSMTPQRRQYYLDLLGG